MHIALVDAQASVNLPGGWGQTLVPSNRRGSSLALLDATYCRTD